MGETSLLTQFSIRILRLPEVTANINAGNGLNNETPNLNRLVSPRDYSGSSYPPARLGLRFFFIIREMSIGCVNHEKIMTQSS